MQEIKFEAILSCENGTYNVYIQERKRRMKACKKRYRKSASFWVFLLPALVFYLLFSLIPTIGGIVYSFTDWTFTKPGFNFVGFENYIKLFKEDTYFVAAFWRTLKFVLVTILTQTTIGLLVAVLVEATFSKLKNIFRTVMFTPYMISTIIGTFMWSFIFSQAFPQLAKSTWFLSFLNQPWVGNPEVAFISIVIVTLWHGIPLMMLIYLAGLEGIPKELQEAAVVDGANGFQLFWRIKLPLIFQSITICMFMTMKDAFKTYEVVYALTGGGPGRSTQVLTLNIYEEAFSNYYKFGYASAKATVFLIVVLTITLLQVGFMKKREVEV